MWLVLSAFGLLLETWLIVALGRQATGRYENEHLVAPPHARTAGGREPDRDPLDPPD